MIIPEFKELKKNDGICLIPGTISINAVNKPYITNFVKWVKKCCNTDISFIHDEINPFIKLIVDNKLHNEEYVLSISDSIFITAKTEIGFSYAMTSLFWLYFMNKGKISKAIIHDEPRFEHRGIMIDSSRHFFQVDEIKKILEQMALLKLNRLHFHLSDDQGYRIESKKFPILNEIGSWLNLGKEEIYGGYYKQAEIKEIVEYAKTLAIEIIPEIDLPGHTCALIAAIPSLSCSKEKIDVVNGFGIFKNNICVGDEHTYLFLDELIEEVTSLFPYPKFHFGGDEVAGDEWLKCPKCQKTMIDNLLNNTEELQAYFSNKVISILHKYHKTPIGWTEIGYGDNLDSNTVIQFWFDPLNKFNTYSEIDKGRKFILSNTDNFYFDYSFTRIPLKTTYSYHPNIKNEMVNDDIILGIEAPLWSERMCDNERLEYMAFPRIAALAEVCWSKEEKNYDDFLIRLNEYIKALDCFKVNYAPLKDLV